MNELISDEQGGREYDSLLLMREEELREQWIEETHGSIGFWEWYDGDFDPREEE